MGFEGQVALVTGGTRGIGAAITERLLAEGVSVTAVFVGNDAAAARFASAMTDIRVNSRCDERTSPIPPRAAQLSTR